MTLSVIIPCLNDAAELLATVQSIRATSPGGKVEIVVVDDCSEPRIVPIPTCKWHRNHSRCGVGKSRHLGAALSDSPWLLFVDAHSRFVPGWYETFASRCTKPDHTAYCGSALGLNEKNMNVAKPNATYSGAKLVLYREKTRQVMEGVWWGTAMRPKEVIPKLADDDVIPCMMGACYILPREFFFQLHGWNALTMWGISEPYISLKWWLAGGEIRLVKGVRIGHMFRRAAPYRTDTWCMTYNKLRAIQELVHEPKLAAYLDSKLNGDVEARRRIKADEKEIKAERRYYEGIFPRTVRDYIQRFPMTVLDE